MKKQNVVLRISVIALAALVFDWIPAANAAQDKSKPNILLISIDDLNDWTGSLGGHPQAKTPNIDRLAKRGVLFANAHCQAPVCTPSRASLVTSKLPSTTGLYFLQPHLQGSEVTRGQTTLVQHFAQLGYLTMGVGKVYGGGDASYFQEYGGGMGGFGPRPKVNLNHRVGHPLWDWGAYPESDEQMPDTKVADWAIKKLKQKHKQPFFLAVGFWRPHVPMYAPQKWFDQRPLKDIKLPKVLKNDRDDLPSYGKNLTIGHPAPRHEWFLKNKQWHHAVQSYLAASTFVDHCVGRVLDALDDSPYAENTIVILFSDHGWHLGEKERWAKRSLWEDATRVPLIFAGPNITSKQVCNRPVGLIDIYPTLLESCGFDAVAEHQGHSLVPLLKSPKANWKHRAITTFGPGNHAVRSTDWRYIRYADGSEELYDHRVDPHEWHNLAGNPKYASVKTEHAQWLPKQEHALIRTHQSAGLDAFLAAEKAAKKKGQ